MAAYWRSPYKEHNNSFRTPNHSTLRFEQSLHLSRARTTINASKYGWTDLSSQSQSSPEKNTRTSLTSHPHPHHQLTLSRSSTTIKGILKTPRRETTSLALGKVDGDTDTSEESTDGGGKKDPKKRVTFGFNDIDADSDNDETRSSVYSKNAKCTPTTLKRISHSRFIEESALKKLNRLIGAVVNEPSLPSVKGKGISPRQTKSLCSHSTDLRCVQCIRKDVDNEPIVDAVTAGKSNDGVKFLLKGNDSTQCKDGKNKENMMMTSVHDSVKTSDVEWAHNVLQERQPVSRGSGVPADTGVSNSRKEMFGHKRNSLVSSASATNARKYYRLLPGRYPFTAGAIQIKQLLASRVVPDGKEKTDDNINGNVPTTTTEKVNVIDLNNGGVKPGKGVMDPTTAHGHTHQKTTSETDTSISRLNSPSKTLGILPTASFGLETRALTIHEVNNNNNELSSNKNKLSSCKRENFKLPPYPDKTSHILDWLNDVHQKQTFKPSAMVANQDPLESPQAS